MAFTAGTAEHALSFRRQVAARLFKFDAFVSYKRDDARPYAAALWQALEAAGMTVAWDGFDIPAGGQLERALCDRVANSRYVIFVDTPLARVSSFVAQELAEAIRLRKHIVRIVFVDPKSDNASWGELEPLRAHLIGEIWVGDFGVNPGKVGPSRNAVAEILKKHRTITAVRKLGWLASALAFVAMSVLAVYLTSLYAHQRAGEALQAFVNPAKSFAEARTITADLFSSPLFAVLDYFAADEHWQLRNVALTTPLKRRELIDLPISGTPKRCEADDAPVARPPEVPPGALCVARQVSPETLVYARRDTSDALSAIRVWRADSGWTTEDFLDIGGFKHLTIFGDRIAAMSDGNVRLLVKSAGAYSELARGVVTGPCNLEFIGDGAWLAVMWQHPKGRREYALSLWDARTGTPVAHNSISLPPDEQSCSDPQTHRALVSTQTGLRAAIGRRGETFEVWNGGQIVPYAPALAGIDVVGAARGGGDTVVYYTSDNQVVVCQSTSACQEALDGISPERGFQAGDGKPDAIRGVALLDANTLQLDTRVGLARCGVDPAAGKCAVDRTSQTGRIVPSSWGAPILRVGLPPRLDMLTYESPDRFIGVDTGVSELRIHSGGGVERVPLVAFDQARADNRVTAAAFGTRQGVVAVALSGTAGSIVYVHPVDTLGRPGSEWRGLRTMGAVLAVWLSDDDGRVNTIERLDFNGQQHVVRGNYPFAPRLVAELFHGQNSWP